MKKWIVISLVAFLFAAPVAGADDFSDFAKSIEEGLNGDVDPDVQAVREAEQNRQDVNDVLNALPEREGSNDPVDALDGLPERVSDGSTSDSKVSILPSTSLSTAECLAEMKKVNMDPAGSKAKFVARDDRYIRIILGCATKTGDIKLWMVPYYVRYILEFVVQLGALAAVGGIVYGGYLYMFAGLSDDKDRGKNAIMYSVGGIVLMAVAWAVVNVFISFFI